ncbi:beta-2-glycoprotein 1-like [Echeneis naucrates]|uniref:Beta-2-glycoprotein 1 n=1 Tax=Echeneis naucrates TaxID=173247 RepID=A0A665VC36_ECHNA|nr:beta-2-glycoprotein 1-like [Echeneis naucrates]
MRHMQTFLPLCALVFFTTMTFGQENACSRPSFSDNIEMDGIQRYFNPGEELTLSCKQGYTPLSGPRTVVCGRSGQWTKTKLKCIPKRCPYPDPPDNGELYYEDTVYQSTVNYTCNEGFVLTGARTATCQANGTWSASAPECKPVTCGLAPIPEFGMIVYEKRIRGDTVDYGVTGTYKCLPPHVVVGNARAECTASGTWTKTPVCQVVTCPPPGGINKGYMSSDAQRDFDFMETVKYGCEGDYVLEGNLEAVCQQNGEWSQKPSCKAPCSVGVQRGRILYKGQKLWIKDLKPNKILHHEIVSFYCIDKNNECVYAMPTQCINGKLKIPDCFEEPSEVQFNLASGNQTSEIRQC